MSDREAIARAIMRAMVVSTSAAVESSRSLGWRERMTETLTTTTTTETPRMDRIADVLNALAEADREHDADAARRIIVAAYAPLAAGDTTMDRANAVMDALDSESFTDDGMPWIAWRDSESERRAMALTSALNRHRAL